MKIGSWLDLDVRADWDQLAGSTARLIPDASVWPIFSRAVSGLAITLCLHRVSSTHQNRMTMLEAELDRFVEGALAHNATSTRWLTLSFDDGYEDAGNYIESRARNFPSVEWLFFVCPEKVEKRAGFRWDLPRPDSTSFDVDRENDRQERMLR